MGLTCSRGLRLVLVWWRVLVARMLAPPPHSHLFASLAHRQNTQPSWTYRLHTLLRSRITELAFKDDPIRQADEVAPIRVMLRGPYGSTFNDCFSPMWVTLHVCVCVCVSLSPTILPGESGVEVPGCVA
jgi:hypothetical protein